MKLPYAADTGQSSIRWQESFGGLDRRLAAGEGAIAAMENMTGDHFPVAASREKRRRLRTLTKPNGFGAGDKLFWADGTGFYYDGTLKGSVSDGKKRFCCLGPWVTIWPDKKFYNAKTDTFGSLEATVSAANAVFSSAAAPEGISDEANCLYLPGTSLTGVFSPGEGLTISGCSRSGNNKTLVVRRVSTDRLYFYDNSFDLDATVSYKADDGLAVGSYRFYNSPDETTYSFTLDTAVSPGYKLIKQPDSINLYVCDYSGQTCRTITLDMGPTGDTELEVEDDYWPCTETGTVTVTRAVPDLEQVCQCDNRLWGVWDNTVCCSYLGNPKIWNNFDSTATACWSVETGSPGAFTGAFAYGGYPLLFKEDHIYRVYGTKNSDFQLFDTETLGAESGSGGSFAVVGQTLYYKSRAGFVAYRGGVPRLIDEALGIDRRQNAVAGTDGRKYYVSCQEGTDYSLLVYDSQNGLWHREDNSEALAFGYGGGELYMLKADGGLWMLGRLRSAAGTAEEEPASMLQFADRTGTQGQSHAVERLFCRVESEGTLTVQVQYDSSGRWELMTDLSSATKRLRTVELRPRRCDHFALRFQGSGRWRLWALGYQSIAGSRREG